MTVQHIVQLSSTRKYRNTVEYTTVPVAKCGDSTYIAPNPYTGVIAPLLKGMLERSEATIQDHVGVFRGDTPIFVEKGSKSPFMPLEWYLDGRAYGVRKKDTMEEED